jgi:hypothetical protein
VSDWLDLRGVTTGLVLAAILWMLSSVRTRWRRRQRKVAEIRERQIPLRVGAGIVAGELRECAEVLDRPERSQAYYYEVLRDVPTREWPDRQHDMAELRGIDRELWDELDDAYGSLRRAKRGAGAADARPPSADSLRRLAERLDRIAE